MNSKLRFGPSNENEHLAISSKIEAEQQRLYHNEQKIKKLQQQKLQLAEEQDEMQHRLQFVREQISKQQQYNNPVIKQLREHFKALKEELRANAQFEEGDDIDIDSMSYEQLLELQETMGKVSKGLSQSKFEALEQFNYQNEYNLQEECTICQEQFVEQQQCLRLPCKHFFHLDCLKGWTQVQKVCPNCKGEIV